MSKASRRARSTSPACAGPGPVKAMGMSGISKSQVSRLCEEIDGKVKAFLERPLEGDWPYLWIDATYLKVRRGGRIVSVAVIIAVGVNGDGRREVLGMEVGTSEAEAIWTEFLRKLRRRGLKGVKLVVSDAHEGIKAAWSPRSSPPPSPRTRARRRACNGGPLPTRSARRCRSWRRSWTRLRPTCWPT